MQEFVWMGVGEEGVRSRKKGGREVTGVPDGAAEKFFTV